jgi:hypothetical protein
MSLADSKARLAGVTKALFTQWDQTRESWRDAKSTEFEFQYLRDLKSDVDKAVAAMEEVEKILAKLRKDCE